MIRLGIDCETYKTVPGLLTPKLVCLTWSDGNRNELLLPSEAVQFARKALLDKDVELVGHRVVYDLAVLANTDTRLLPLIFDAIEQGRVKDTLIRQQLMDIATGQFEYFDFDHKRVKNRHSLQQYVSRYFGVDIAKGVDSWQLRFGELDGLELEEWPEEARKYALEDAVWARTISLKQDIEAGADIPTETDQTKAYWALHLMAVRGIRADIAKTHAFRDKLVKERAQLEKELIEAGVMRADGSKNMTLIKELIKKAYGGAPPLTDKGNICADKAALKESGDPVLLKITQHTHCDKYLETYLPVMLQACNAPFNPQWKPLVTSGRTSCGDPEAPGNLQNLPRSGGIRECYIPRPGMYFCSTDLDTAEMRSWAEVCLELGIRSQLADELNRGLDPHVSFAASLGNTTYDAIDRGLKSGDKDAKNFRQLAKIGNFGLGGGLSAAAFVDYCKGYGVEIPYERSKEICDSWHRHYHESRPYFNWVRKHTESSNPTIVHPITGFVRGDLTYTSLANHMFQTLTASAAKEGLWLITKDCYLVSKSPLFGSRPVLFTHDEVATETPKERSHEAACRQAELMVQGANKYIKRVKNSCSPALSEFLAKDAKAVYDENRRLVPWQP